MKHTGRPPAIRTRQPDWTAAALSAVTLAALIAAAVAGAYLTVTGGQGNVPSGRTRKPGILHKDRN